MAPPGTKQSGTMFFGNLSEGMRAVRWTCRIYPVTIVRTRYDGLYEGDEWTAFACASSYVPWDVLGGDVCEKWWADPDRIVAVGTTPDEALGKLQLREDIPARYRFRAGCAAHAVHAECDEEAEHSP